MARDEFADMTDFKQYLLSIPTDALFMEYGRFEVWVRPMTSRCQNPHSHLFAYRTTPQAIARIDGRGGEIGSAEIEDPTKWDEDITATLVDAEDVPENILTAFEIEYDIPLGDA